MAKQNHFFSVWDARRTGYLPKIKKWFSFLLMVVFIVHPLFVYAGPQSATYELKEFGFGAGGVASASSATYSLFGLAGEIDLASTSATNYALQAGLTFTLQADVPPAPSFTNPGSTYDRLLITLSEGDNPPDTEYAIAITDDNWITTKYIQSDYTVGSVLGEEDWLLYSGGQGIGWGGSGGFYVTGLTNSTVYQIKTKARQGDFTESRWSNISSQTTSDPSLSFSINSEIGGLSGFWKMDEATGSSVTDSSGNGNDAVFQTNLTWVTGKFGSAVNLDSANDYLFINDDPTLRVSDKTITVSVWARRNGGTGQWRTLIDKGTPAPAGGVGAEYWFGFNTEDRLTFMLNPGDSSDADRFYVSGTSVITDSSWHHLAAVYNGKDVRIYIDGTLNNTPSTHTEEIYSSTGDVAIGATRHFGNTYSFLGDIDEVRIYQRALTSKQVEELYNATPNLVSSLYFNNLNAGNGYTDTSRTTTLITSTNAYNGYIVYAYETGALTHTADVTKTIADYASPNSSPTVWSGTGFGYTTDDDSLTGGTPDRFTNGGPKYARFTTTPPGDPIADHAGPVTSPITDERFTISYRVTAPSSVAAGTYQNYIEYIITPTY